MEYNGETIFSQIVDKKIPAQIIFENERILAFKDINPKAPHHILIVPKKKLVGVVEAEDADRALLGEMVIIARDIAGSLGLAERGFRLVINSGPEGGQTVAHLHLHLLGGRELEWPPG